MTSVKTQCGTRTLTLPRPARQLVSSQKSRDMILLRAGIASGRKRLSFVLGANRCHQRSSTSCSARQIHDGRARDRSADDGCVFDYGDLPFVHAHGAHRFAPFASQLEITTKEYRQCLHRCVCETITREAGFSSSRGCQVQHRSPIRRTFDACKPLVYSTGSTQIYRQTRSKGGEEIA